MMPIGKQIMKCFDSAIAFSAGAAFNSIHFFNKYRPSPSFIPRFLLGPDTTHLSRSSRGYYSG